MRPSMLQIPEAPVTQRPPHRDSKKPEPKALVKTEPKPKRISKSVAALLNDSGGGVDTKKAIFAANSAKKAYNSRINAKSI